MLWALFWIAAYLLMIGVTRAVYEIATPNPPRYSWGERKDEARYFVPMFWPIGLPIIAGDLFGEYVRKCIDEINREDERHD